VVDLRALVPYLQTEGQVHRESPAARVALLVPPEILIAVEVQEVHQPTLMILAGAEVALLVAVPVQERLDQQVILVQGGQVELGSHLQGVVVKGAIIMPWVLLAQCLAAVVVAKVEMGPVEETVLVEK